MPIEAPRGLQVHLSTAAAAPAERRLALAVVVVSSLAFAAAAPFARTPLAPQPVFIAVYQSALAINDIVTAVLLFGLYGILRSRALLLLAGGYQFTALIAIVHALTFPGLFAPAGLLGASMQTTAWLYMIWHGGFALAVIGYVLLARAGPTGPTVPAGVEIGAMVFAVVAAVAAATSMTTMGAPLLPAIMSGNRYTPAMISVVGSVWALSAVAIAMLWLAHLRSTLDVWLMVVMCAWVFDIGLSAVLNAGRFDLGFYVGRLYGLLASCLVLGVLLTQTLRVYAHLAAANEALRDVALRDGLTGVFNRRQFDEALCSELRRASRSGLPLSLLLLDVDHFKQFNDTHGHVAGDACLRGVADAIGQGVGRPSDLLARFGGEEFVVLLPDTDAAGAVEVAERMRGLVAARDQGDGRRVTVSIGTATLWADTPSTPEELIATADMALYAAKRDGRNRVSPPMGLPHLA